MLGIVVVIYGLVLTVWGLFNIKNNNMLFGENIKSKNFFDLLINGQASGVGQFLSGLICITLGIMFFVIKK